MEWSKCVYFSCCFCGWSQQGDFFGWCSQQGARQTLWEITPEPTGHGSEFLSFFLPETGYLEPESHCLVQSSLAGKCFVCIVHKRKTRGHNYKQSLRHERLSGTALQIVEDGFQILLKNREPVCVLENGERRGQGCAEVFSWAWPNAKGDLRIWLMGAGWESWVSSALEEWAKGGMLLLSSAI